MIHKRSLFLPLTGEWYNKIESGEKSIDYRLQSDHWVSRLEGKTFDNVVCCYGYTLRRLVKKWVKTEKLDSGIDTDLKTDKPVYAIYFKDQS